MSTQITSGVFDHESGGLTHHAPAGAMMQCSIREARLKPEFAHLYPPVSAGVWTPAAEVGARMLFWHLQLTGVVRLGERLLAEEHFEFRGGWTRGDSSDLRTRAGDANAAEPRRVRSA